MFFRMVFKVLLKQKSKMLMIALTIALGVSLSTAMINIMLGVGDKVNRELKIYGANINVMHKDASLLNDLYGIDSGEGVNDKFLSEDDIFKIKEIFWGFNIVDFAPFLEVNSNLDGIGEIRVIGTWVEMKRKLPTGEEVDTGMRNLRTWWEIELKGDWLSQEDHEYCMVGSLLAGRNNIEVGDELKLTTSGKEKTLIVKGIFTDGGKDDEKIITTLKTAQEISSLEGRFRNLEVSALTTPDNDLAKKAAQDPLSLSPDEYETWYCTAYVSAISHQIQEVITDGVAKPVRRVAESEGTILKKTTLLMTLITILSAFGSALAISNLVTSSVMDRRQEIGLMKAIGSFDISIIMLILTEILITGIIGGIIGYFAGIGLAQIIGRSVFGSSIEVAKMVIPIISVIVIAVTLLGSIPAIRYLLRLKPTEVLHGK